MADHGWVIAVDGEGNEYYFNNNTQESAWELPAGVEKDTVKKQTKWAKIVDGESFYFYNNVTGESTWEKPPDYDGELDGIGEEVAVTDDAPAAAAAAPAPAAAAPAPAAAAAAAPAAAPAAADAEAKADGGNATSVAGAVAAVQAAQKWLAVVDEESGGTYYYNNETGECQWEKPDDFEGGSAEGASKETMQKILKAKLKLAALDSETRNKIKAAQSFQKQAAEEGKLDWVECYDPASDAFYYTNKKTGATTWDKPPNYIMAADDEMTHAVVKIQCMFRGKIARGEVTIKKKAKKEKEEKWVAVEDESGATYYYNNETGECQWEKPDDYFGASAEGASKETMEKILKAKLKLAALDSETRNKIKAAQSFQKQAAEEGKLDWVECYDPASDAFYYTNKKTGATTWDKPENYIMAADDEMTHAVVKIQCMFRGKIARGEVKIKKQIQWEEVIDAESGKPYYHNKKTGDITWERPEELGGPIVDPAIAAARKEETEQGLVKALSVKLKEARLDSDTRKKLKKAKKNMEQAKSVGALDRWVECYDPGSDGFYYYNQVSGETTWDKPTDYIMAADDEMMMAVVKIQCLFRAKMAKRRAAGMVTRTRDISADKHAEALDRMRKLNEEEMEMKRQMEDLRREKEERLLKARLNAKDEKEAQRLAALSEEEAWREQRVAQSQQAARDRRAARKAELAAKERLRKQRRAEKLAAIEKKMAARRAAEAEAKAAADKERDRQREARRMKRAREKRLKEQKWKTDCAAWQARYKQARSEEAARERERRSMQHKQFMQQREDLAARARVAERRQARHDAAVHSVWDAAMHGVTRDRANVLLNVAIADAAKTAAAEAQANGVPVEAVPASGRPLNDLSAGVGTAPNSRSHYHVDVANEVGESPLHVAAWRGQAAVVAALLAQGADVNIVDTVYSQTTPLHEAVRAGYRDVVKILINGGALVDLQDASGDTPLHWACRRGDQGIAELLLDADPDKATPSILNYKNKRPGQCAKRGGVVHLMRTFEPEPPAPPAQDTRRSKGSKGGASTSTRPRVARRRGRRRRSAGRSTVGGASTRGY